MTRSHTTAAALGAALVLAACADPAAPNGADGPLVDGPRFAAQPAAADAADGYLVFLKPDAKRSRSATADDVAAIAARVPRARVQALRFTRAVVVRGTVDVAALAADPRVERVSENSIYQRAAFSTTATFWRRGWQWNMRQIGADQVPNTVTGAGRRVCVVDGGVNPAHQDLAGKVVAAAAFPGAIPYAPEDDFDSHGSHVASTITSNGIGVAAVAPNAVILNANVFGPDAGTSVARIVDGMNWCVANGADVINMSLGGARTRGTPGWVADSITYTNATQAARAAGTVVIAAAGNNNRAIPSLSSSSAFLPAEATGVIAVGATGPAIGTTFPFTTPAPAPTYDVRAGYSNFNTGNDALGPGVIIYAPGGNGGWPSQGNITAACAPSAGPGCSDGKRYFSIFGTSMASPHVAGVAALIASRTNAPRSAARVAAIESCLLSTGDVLGAGTPFFARPRLNARRAATEACPGL